MPEFGDTPCQRCNALIASYDGDKSTLVGFCSGFDEWPINEMPQPVTVAAIGIGCTCRDNPDDCRIHAWICRHGGRCEHEYPDRPEDKYTINHASEHYSCEHCTIPRIECEACGKIWFDWRVPATVVGWHQRQTETENLNEIWRCGTCQTTSTSK
jgi:hypothetical protein